MPQKKILIADDDAQLVRALSVRLNEAGFDVIAARDSYQAVAFARAERPDLMLLDINMPAGDGFSVQQRIEEIPETAGIPVVYLTGEAPESVDGVAQQAGAFAVLHKPFETENLLETIRAAMGFWVQPSHG